MDSTVQQPRRSRLESISGGNGAHDAVFRVARDYEKTKEARESTLGCNLMAMVRLAFSDPVLYHSTYSNQESDFSTSDEYGSNKGARASYAGVPRRISFRRRRPFHNSKVSLISSPSSHNNSMANVYPLPSPSAAGMELHDKRRWSLSISKTDFMRSNDHGYKSNHDASSTSNSHGSPAVASSQLELLGLNKTFPQPSSIAQLTAQLKQLDFDASFNASSVTSARSLVNTTPICSPCLTSSTSFKAHSSQHNSVDDSNPSRSNLNSSQTSPLPPGGLTTCRSFSYPSKVGVAGSDVVSSGLSPSATLHINCSPSMLQISTADLASLSLTQISACNSVAAQRDQNTSSTSSTGVNTPASPCNHYHQQLQQPQIAVNSPMKPRARSLSPTRNCLPLDTSIHLMNDMYRERFPNAISQMEEKLLDFIATNGGVMTPSSTSTAIAAPNSTLSSSTAAQKLSQQLSLSTESSACPFQTSTPNKEHAQPSTPKMSRLVGTSPSNSPLVSTPNPESDPVVSFVSNQILKLARDCLDKSTEKNLTGAYFNELCIKVEKLLGDAIERVENARQLEPVLQRGNKLLSIVSRPARLLECLEFDPEVFYSRLESGQEYAPVQWDLAERMNKDLPSYILRLLGEKRDINRLSCYDSGGGYDSGRPHTPDTDESEPLPRALPCEADFEQIKLISNGAYGAVYLVRHKLTKQRFAEKRIKKQDLVLRNMLDQVFAERDILMFAQNPFVVSMLCSFETKKHLCMIMEYVEGGDVGTLLKNVGALPYDLARMYFAETVLAVEYLHSYGIVHRDLKPDNLLITSEGHIKLTDFGLSRMGLMSLACNLYEDLSRPGMFNDGQIFGTPEYIAPECFQKRAYGKPVDWWSCGVILYEFLMGDTPFYGDTPEELFDCALSTSVPWPPPLEDGEEYPPLVAQSIVEDLLVKDPLHRRGTGGALEVKGHPFFNELDWNALLKQKAEFIPLLEGDEDTSYFDTRSDRYNHGRFSDTESDEDDCDSSSMSIQSQLSSSFSACSPRYQRLFCQSGTTSASNSTGTGSNNTSNCSSPQPHPLNQSPAQSAVSSQTAMSSSGDGAATATVQGAQDSSSNHRSNTEVAPKDAKEPDQVPVEEIKEECNKRERQKSASELNSSFEKPDDSEDATKTKSCHAVKSLSDSKLSKALSGEKVPALPPRSTKPAHYVPEYLQKPIHVDSGVDSSGGCHTPDETPSPIIPPRDFTPKVMSGANGTGSVIGSREPKLPPNAVLFSPTTPTKPTSRHPGLSPAEEKLNLASGGEPGKKQGESSASGEDDDDASSTLEAKKPSGDSNLEESVDSECVLGGKEKDACDLSADEHNNSNSNLSCLETSSCTQEDSSANSSECNDHTLTAVSGADVSKQLSAKLAETLKLELSSSVEKEKEALKEALFRRKAASTSKSCQADRDHYSHSHSSKKTKGVHSSTRKSSSSSRQAAIGGSKQPEMATATMRPPLSAKICASDDKMSFSKSAPSGSLLTIMLPSSAASSAVTSPASSSSTGAHSVRGSGSSRKQQQNPSSAKNLHAASSNQPKHSSEASSGHGSRRHVTTPPSATADARKKSKSPSPGRGTGYKNTAVNSASSPLSSDISPDRLSGSNSTLKSTQTQSKPPHEEGSMSRHAVNKQSFSGPGVNTGPIFPRIPIKDTLPVIKRGNRGYGFHMKAIKVYSMQSEDFTIQHLVTYVDPSGPAFLSGLKENDLITHIGGQSIQGMAHTEVVYLIIQSRDQLYIQATPLHETSIKNDCARRKGPGIGSTQTTGNLYGSPTTTHSAASSGTAVKNKKSRNSRAHHTGRSRASLSSVSSASTLKDLEKPQIIKPKMSSRDIVQGPAASPVVVSTTASQLLGEYPTHVFPTTESPNTMSSQKQRQRIQQQQQSSIALDVVAAATVQNAPSTVSAPPCTNIYSQPFAAPVFTTTPTSSYSPGPSSKSKMSPSTSASSVPSVQQPPSKQEDFAVPASSAYPSTVPKLKSLCPVTSTYNTGFANFVTSSSPGMNVPTVLSTSSAMPPTSDHRPQMLNIKLGPKSVPNRRKSGNNIPVSPLARTPSPSRTKPVNASPSLVTAESGSGVTVMQRKGGGAITCPSGSRSVTVSPQASAAATHTSPSSASKLAGAHDGYQSCPTTAHSSPKLDQPPPVPARIPVGTPIAAPCIQPSTAATLPDSHPLLVPTFFSSPRGGSGDHSSTSKTKSTAAQQGLFSISPVANEVVASSSCPHIGVTSSFVSPMAATCCISQSSFSLTNTPNIIKASSSSNYARSATITAPSVETFKSTTHGDSTGSDELWCSSEADTVVSIASPPTARPSLPPRSPSN